MATRLVMLGLFVSCALASRIAAGEVPEVARVFLEVPDHFVGNLSKKDRRWWLKELHLPDEYRNVIEGRNLHFSFDGEEPLGGEGPFTVHVFASIGSRRAVGIFIERFYDVTTRIPPATSLYILLPSEKGWRDVTREVLPEPFDPRLYYEFSPSSDVLTVRAYGRSPENYVTPAEVLKQWTWSGVDFKPAP